ncbi:MAG TPA: hypothetical protein VIZ18_15955 [Ktedonobacteraceae bacterium]
MTGRALSQAAGISLERALTFLRQQRSGTPTQDRARQRQQKLERVCARLEAQGVRVTSPLLAKEAKVMKQTAIDFLTARRRASHATL